ncbi:hypothetical protein IE53DRAFT_388192 [Violaceomyces palustris]|uniref:Uncharacterized protein n=1 Tax=Violaceomyces palustris TaxID=1673888 RepID=A0ACD0NUT7_9BASI|nr:hypothetical protein IE53DRAFT_388192 [Violaceomyces palustris]
MANPSVKAQIQSLQNRIDIESKIKDGAENLLHVFDMNQTAAAAKQGLRKQIENELETATAKINSLYSQIEKLTKRNQADLSPIQGVINLSDLENSALGLDSFNDGATNPSQVFQGGSSRYHLNQSSRPNDLLGTGSPPSTNFANELRSATTTPAIGPTGGLGIGLEGSPGPALGDRTFGQSRSNHVGAEKENDDAQAMRALSAALIRALRPSDLRESSTSSPSTLSNLNTELPVTTTSEPVSPRGVMPPPLPSITAASSSRIVAPRSRAAALTSSKGTHAHVRTPSNAGGLADASKKQIDTMSRLVTVLQRNARARYELPLDDFVDSILPCLSDQAGKEVRASAYRLLRHALVQPPWPLISRLRNRGLDMYLTRSLVRDGRFEAEKEQALKLVRSIMELGASRTVNAAPDRFTTDLNDLIGSGVVRTIAAVAENSEDKLRHLCLETLAELAIFDIRLLVKGGGLRPTLQALTEGPTDFAPALVQTFLYLVDMPRTRSYLRPGVDLEIAFSGFTESPAQKPVMYEALLRSTAKVVSVMLRSWSGLLYMCMDNKRAISSIVQALRINPDEVKTTILDMLYDLFNVGTSASNKAFTGGKRDSVHKTQPSSSTSNRPESSETGASAVGPAQIVKGFPEQTVSRLNLVDHYLSLLLVVFVEAGLVDALVHVIEHSSELGRKSTLLMGEILQVSRRVLPPTYGLNIHSLPHLFALAASFRGERTSERQAAVSALSSIDHLNRQRARHEGLLSSSQSAHNMASRERSNSVEETMRRGQRQVEKTKMRLGMQIDDNHFRNLLLETQVLNTKDHVKWNLDTLMEMLEGPLLNPKRLEEAMRGSKFMRRILGFFHPFALRFSSIRRLKPNRRFIKLGCTLLNTLLCNPDGIRFLAEDRLLREIRECLEQLDPMAGAPVPDPLMSKSRLEETLTSGYFEMIGVLTQSIEGVRLLERFKIFTPLYHLSELRSRDDIIKAVIENVDYSIDGHPRVVLSKALTSNYMHVRLFATKHLSDLISKSSEPSEWMIALLLQQLYDPSLEVRETAVRIVEEACQVMSVLQMVVSMRPTLDHLGEVGHPLLLKFLSTSIGFRYLWQGEYIDREMDHWFNERNQRYVVQIEIMLSRVFSIDRSSGSKAGNTSSSLGAENEIEFDGTAPPHFYGELAKTEEGCQILDEKGHFSEFAHFIRQHGMEHSDAELIVKLKSVLWAVGNIGSTARGLPFLEREDVISHIVEIAENSLVMSVRGTCFFILGLISGTIQGAELLHDYGWVSVCTPLGVPVGLCVPGKVDSFIEIPSWKAWEDASLTYVELAHPDGAVEQKIVSSIANLGNSILANNASRTLAKLKSKHRACFSDPQIFARALEQMDNFYIRLPIRRYIWELFDFKLDEDAVRSVQVARKILIEKKRKSRKAASTNDESRKGDRSKGMNTILKPRPKVATTVAPLNAMGGGKRNQLLSALGDFDDEVAEPPTSAKTVRGMEGRRIPLESSEPAEFEENDAEVNVDVYRDEEGADADGEMSTSALTSDDEDQDDGDGVGGMEDEDSQSDEGEGFGDDDDDIDDKDDDDEDDYGGIPYRDERTRKIRTVDHQLLSSQIGRRGDRDEQKGAHRKGSNGSSGDGEKDQTRQQDDLIVVGTATFLNEAPEPPKLYLGPRKKVVGFGHPSSPPSFSAVAVGLERDGPNEARDRSEIGSIRTISAQPW